MHQNISKTQLVVPEEGIVLERNSCGPLKDRKRPNNSSFSTAFDHENSFRPYLLFVTALGFVSGVLERCPGGRH